MRVNKPRGMMRSLWVLVVALALVAHGQLLQAAADQDVAATDGPHAHQATATASTAVLSLDTPTAGAGTCPEVFILESCDEKNEDGSCADAGLPDPGLLSRAADAAAGGTTDGGTAGSSLVTVPVQRPAGGADGAGGGGEQPPVVVIAKTVVVQSVTVVQQPTAAAATTPPSQQQQAAEDGPEHGAGAASLELQHPQQQQQQQQQPDGWDPPADHVSPHTPSKPKRSPTTLPSPEEFEKTSSLKGHHHAQHQSGPPPQDSASAAAAGAGSGGGGGSLPQHSGQQSDASHAASAAAHSATGTGVPANGHAGAAAGGSNGQPSPHHHHHHHQPMQSPPAYQREQRRINLAAAADGASVVAANPEARKPDKVIDNDEDSFMKNYCSANKWIVVELSQLGRIDVIELTMKEPYSGRVKDFVVKGRQSHPQKDYGPDFEKGFASDASWQLLGAFTAANARGEQSFALSNRQRVKYLLLQLLSHYGTDEVCALNSLRALGVTAAQELEEALVGEFEATPPEEEAPPVSQPSPPPPPPAAMAVADVEMVSPLPPGGGGGSSSGAASSFSAAEGGASLQPPQPQPHVPVEPSVGGDGGTATAASAVGASGSGDDNSSAETGNQSAAGPGGSAPSGDASSAVSESGGNEAAAGEVEAAASQQQHAQSVGPGPSSSSSPVAPEERPLQPPALQQPPASGASSNTSNSTTAPLYMTEASSNASLVEGAVTNATAAAGEAASVSPNASLGGKNAEEALNAATGGVGELGPDPAAPPSAPQQQPPPASSGSGGDGAVSAVSSAAGGLAGEMGAASKVKQGGNLFDVVKQEIVSLRLNQTKVWQYMRELVDALNKKTAELEADDAALAAQLQSTVAAARSDIEASLRRSLAQELAPYADVLAQTRAALQRSQRRETALLLYNAATFGGAVCLLWRSPDGRLFKAAVILLSIANGLVGIAVNLQHHYDHQLLAASFLSDGRMRSLLTAAAQHIQRWLSSLLLLKA